MSFDTTSSHHPSARHPSSDGTSLDVTAGVGRTGVHTGDGTGSHRSSGGRGAPLACRHDLLPVGRLRAEVCPEGPVAWFDGGEEIDPAVALAQLFGQFDLVSAVDGIGSPGPTVFVYRPDGRRGRSALRDLPAGGWVEGAPGLWIGRDDRHLLICPSDPVLAANLLRRS